MALCSFGKFPIKGLFTPFPPYSDHEEPFGTPLYGRLLYIRSEQTEALIVALDFLGTFPEEARRFQREVSQKTGIPAENIWYHELQVHASLRGPQVQGDVMDRLIERAAAEVNQIKTRAVPFTCEVAEADVGTRYSMNREQYVAGLGGVTIWTGMSFDKDRRAYSQNPDIMLLRGYKPSLPVFDKPIYFDNPVDQKAYLFVFRDEQGNVIGTMSRFAAHPDVAVLFELRGVSDQYRFNFDWPGYLSEKLERAFNAPSLYINGPCANLSTKKGYDGMDTYEVCANEAKRIGEELADMLLARFEKKRVTLGNADNLKATTFSFELPMRENFPHSLAELALIPERVEEAEKALQQAIADKAPDYRIKQLVDDRYRAAMDREMIEDICGFDDETLARRTVTATVSVMRLGDYLFFGVPGESLVDMGLWLRTTFTGVKTIPVDQVNGYYSYMATPTSLTLGGYTYWASWLDRTSIPLLKEGLVEKMDEFLD